MKRTDQIALSTATILIAVFSLLSRAAGLLRDRLLAARFGAGDALDVYTASFRVPDFLYNLLILGTLSAAFIPVFTEYVRRDRDEAWAVARTILNTTIAVMGALAVILMFFSPILVALLVPGFPPAKQALTVTLTRVMLLTPLLFSVSSVFSSVLNSFRRFLLVASLPVIYNLAIIGGILFLEPRFGLIGLAWGVVAGAILHMSLQIPAVLRLGFRFSLGWDLQHPGVRRVIRTFVPRVFGMDLGQISFFISSIIGSMLASGSVAVYSLAFNLESVPIGIIAIAFATVAFTLLSEAAASEDKEKFRQILQSNFSQILFLIVPMGILMVVLRAQIVRIVLGSGHFSWDDTLRTIEALGYFGISLFAQSLVPLLSRAFYAMKNTIIPVVCGLTAAGINIVAALLLVPHYQVAGLALAFSIGSLANLILLFVTFEMKYGNIVDAPLFLKLEKIAVAAVLAGIAAYAGLYIIEPFVATSTVIGLLIQAVGASLAGGGAYLLAGMLLGISESRHLASNMKVWMNRLRLAFARFPGLFQ
ncbi:MAG: murein biosynthesis integral membrane protein MurJ [Candidatus Doudnabacteria bacterium RIFCSPHIGHO2_01_FULL_50_11]|uniref:Probable lipid II flippase MurJ n=1 Tax=Candidatus Doudnabacteria bacterium RIFCSPHIGHO2_01_FULL_50_11 TaxID=1817828 RepID=A0A1F5PIU4_9BACT|nr:MAG: murein biosynthesis integral membrane protein MurJ [Candidatus Doudnabacteria bacterium RIFCSPHIGHO2_01_FULL_50_11]